ncbi:MAG: 16S rRNA (uracil(1498)-N(3))-methyltransferase [Bacteroidota bacterium]
MHLFYIPEIHAASNEVKLSEEESKHACKVLRLKKGDKISLLNGKGDSFVGEIIEDHPKHCLISIKSHAFEEQSPNQIHIAIAPTKNIERIEWFVEKTTELGITEISLFFSKNSERKHLKIERIEKIIISAMKQSQRKYLPKLNVFSSLEEFFKVHTTGAIAHCYQGNKLALKSNLKKTKYPILIGPEGDFTQEEVELALKKGFDPITLGKNRLRTETAGLYACMQAKLILES